jgi:hypothetical protein
MTWLRNINMLELSPVKHPANRRPKLFQKAKWSTAYINDLPDSAFLYIETGGKKDDEGKTTPRTKRHFPVRDHTGALDRAHVANAISRIPQSTAPGVNVDALQTKARALLEKLNKSTEDPMVTDKALQEYLTKSSLPTEVADFVKATIEAMTKSKGKLTDEAVTKAKEAISSLFGFGATSEEVTKAKADAEKAAGEEKAKLVETVKSALDKLQADKPLVGEAVNSLAELAGVTPVVKMVDQLPPEMKAQWEAMVKNNKANQEEMEKLQKSIDEQREATARQEFIAKAAGLSNIPLKAEELGELLSVVSKTDAEKGEKLLTTLKSVDELLAKGEALRELGTEGNITPPAAKAAITRLDKMAEEMVVKSAGKLTREQAFVKALELHPELYDEYNAATQ